MIIIPAIDLINGSCVRLYQGDYEKMEIVAGSVVETAKGFEDEGAEFIHVVDLDGAKSGMVEHYSSLSDIINNTHLKVEFGGGIRDIATIEKLINIGVDRVVIGSMAKNKEFVKTVLSKFKEHIAIGIDARNEMVSTHGWLQDSSIHYIDFAKEMESLGAKYIIFTDISRDGTLAGPNYEQLAMLQKSVSCNITASGGIRDLEHIKKLREMNLYGAIAGKSLYSGTLNLKEAIDECM